MCDAGGFTTLRPTAKEVADPNAPPLTVSWPIDDGNATVAKKFYPPFTRVDREAEYARAWEIFERRYGKEAGR